MKALLVVALLALTATLTFAQTPLRWVRTNHLGGISNVIISDDMRDLVSTSIGDEIIVWDAATGEYLRKDQLGIQHTASYPYHLQISSAFFVPGKKELLIATDSGIYFYDVESMSIKQRIGLTQTINTHYAYLSQTQDTLMWVAGLPYYPQRAYRYSRSLDAFIDSVDLAFEVFHPSNTRNGSLPLISTDFRYFVATDHSDLQIIDFDRDTAVKMYDGRIGILQGLSLDGRSIILNDRDEAHRDLVDISTLAFQDKAIDGLGRAPSSFAAYNNATNAEYFVMNYMNAPVARYFYGDIFKAQAGDTLMITAMPGGIAVSPTDPKVTSFGHLGISSFEPVDGELLSQSVVDWQSDGYVGVNYDRKGTMSGIRRGNYSSDNTHRVFAGNYGFTHYMAGSGFYCFNEPKIHPTDSILAVGLDIFSMVPASTGHHALTCPTITAEWSATGSHYVWSAFNDSLVVQDMGGNRVGHITGHRKITSIAVSLTQDLIATTGIDSTIKLWTIDGQLVKTFIGHTAQVNDVNFAPNGRQLVSASSDSTIRVWDIDKGEIYKYTQFRERFWQAAVSNDGLTVIGASDRSIVGFNAADWASVKPVVAEASNTIKAYSSNGVVTIEHDLETDKPVQLEVYDLIGRLLHRAEYTSNRITFDATGHGNSPLIFTVSQDGERATAMVPKL